MEKSWNFVNNFDETTSSQKNSCQTHKFVCLTASFQATGIFKLYYFKMHSCSTGMPISAVAQW